MKSDDITKGSENLETLFKNQQAILEKVIAEYEQKLKGKDLILENQREIIVRQSIELEEMRNKN
jgi:hypothetical protein